MTMACGLDLHSTSDHVRCGGGGVRRGVEGPVVAAGSGAVSTVVARRRDASGARRPGGVGGGGLHRLAAAHHYGQPGDLASIAASSAATRAAIDALDSGDHDLAARLWGLDGPALLYIWDRWNTRAREVGPRWNQTPSEPVGPRTQGVPTALCTRVYERDRYRCRYCGIHVFTRSSGQPDRSTRLCLPRAHAGTDGGEWSIAWLGEIWSDTERGLFEVLVVDDRTRARVPPKPGRSHGRRERRDRVLGV